MDLARSLQTLVSLVRAFARSLGRTRKQRADAVARSERGQWRLGVRATAIRFRPSVCLSLAAFCDAKSRRRGLPYLLPSFLPFLS